MKRKIIYIIILSIIGLYSCKSTKSDYGTLITDEEIYEFMKFVVSDLNISSDTEIQLNPEPLFYDLPDRNTYKISDFCYYRVKLDSTELKSQTPIIKVKSGKFRVFKASDSSFVLNQNKRILNNFKWKPKKFGHNQNRSPRKQWFSLPYFSIDRKTVVLFESYEQTDVFMAGGSSLLCYTKTENGWEKKFLKMTLN